MNSAISPDLRLLCQLISGQTTPQAIAANKWENIVHQAKKHDMQPLLAWHVKQNQFTLPDNFQQQLMLDTQQAAARYALFYHAQHQITTALNHAQIPYMWLKGLVLAQTVYPAPFQRLMLDMDVLVPYEHRLQALAVLENVGYRQGEDEHSLFSPNELAHNDQMHHFFLRGGTGASIILELHFYLLRGNEAKLPAQNLVWFWQQTIIIDTEKFSFVGLAPEAHLLYLCAHAVLHHGLYEFVLKRYLDLHFLIQQSSLNWEVIITHSVELRWTYAVERALQLTQELFDTPIPSHVFTALREKRYPDENLQLVDAKSDAGAQFEMVRTMLRSMTWYERLRYVHLIVLPPPSYIRQHYHVPENRRIWSYYLKRWYAQLRQIGWVFRNRFLSKLCTNRSD